jgi:hypothetical protein
LARIVAVALNDTPGTPIAPNGELAVPPRLKPNT